MAPENYKNSLSGSPLSIFLCESRISSFENSSRPFGILLSNSFNDKLRDTKLVSFVDDAAISPEKGLRLKSKDLIDSNPEIESKVESEKLLSADDRFFKSAHFLSEAYKFDNNT